MAGPQQGLGHARRVADLGGPFGHATEHAAVVDLLEGVAAQVVAWYLTHDEQEGHAVLLGGVHRDGRIGGAGAAAHQRDAGRSRQPRIGEGHEARAGLVAADHRVDVVAVMQGVEQAQEALPGNAEHARDSVADQGVDDQVAGGSQGNASRLESAQSLPARDDVGNTVNAGPTTCIWQDPCCLSSRAGPWGIAVTVRVVESGQAGQGRPAGGKGRS
jgi:hypothetical protein